MTWPTPFKRAARFLQEEPHPGLGCRELLNSFSTAGRPRVPLSPALTANPLPPLRLADYPSLALLFPSATTAGVSSSFARPSCRSAMPTSQSRRSPRPREAAVRRGLCAGSGSYRPVWEGSGRDGRLSLGARSTQHGLKLLGNRRSSGLLGWSRWLRSCLLTGARGAGSASAPHVPHSQASRQRLISAAPAGGTMVHRARGREATKDRPPLSGEGRIRGPPSPCPEKPARRSQGPRSCRSTPAGHGLVPEASFSLIVFFKIELIEFNFAAEWFFWAKGAELGFVADILEQKEKHNEL